ncbi:transposase [Baaleninema simplex]|uniref:transposase n=1 Tax=Baaleninema simplex TaxID=2862350 RepID=UPI001181900C
MDLPQVEATNNPAERQLRPALIARKVSCSNKTESSARTWDILASLAALTSSPSNPNGYAGRFLGSHQGFPASQPLD